MGGKGSVVKEGRKCYKCSVVGNGFVKELLRITPLGNFATAGKKFVSGRELLSFFFLFFFLIFLCFFSQNRPTNRSKTSCFWSSVE